MRSLVISRICPRLPKKSQCSSIRLYFDLWDDARVGRRLNFYGREYPNIPKLIHDAAKVFGLGALSMMGLCYFSLFALVRTRRCPTVANHSTVAGNTVRH